MSDKSGVSWTTYSWGLWRGCNRVGAGCRNCYAERDMRRFGKDFSTVTRASDATWRKALKWNREAEKARRTDMVFVCPWSDFWHEAADGWRKEAFEIIDQCPHLIFQIPTKRPENIRPQWRALAWSSPVADGRHHEPFPRRDNVWLGASASTQAEFDAAWSHLQKCADLTSVLWLSLEPLLGPIVLPSLGFTGPATVPDWIVVGSESGPNRRPCDPDWIRSIRDQCRAAGMPLFVKQDSGPRPGMQGRIPDDVWACKEWPR